MSVAPAHVPIPSLLSEDASEWVRSFAVRLRDEVARPLFAAESAERFVELLPDCLIRGATLRFRWLNAVSGMPQETRSELTNIWLRSPPPTVLEELRQLGAELLGDVRSFQLQRALAMTFTDGLEGARALMERMGASQLTPEQLMGMARLLEVAAPHDVLSLAWMMVLLGDVPPPNPEVADAAASELLVRTTTRVAALQEVFSDASRARDWRLEGLLVPRPWWLAHPQLVTPTLMLLGFAWDDASIEQVFWDLSQDPEDEHLSTLEFRLSVFGRDPDEVQLALEERALRAGVLGAMADDQGAMICLTSTRAPAH